jgi:hypothetical protein
LGTFHPKTLFTLGVNKLNINLIIKNRNIMLQFKKASERVSTLKTIGTVAEFVGAGGYHELASLRNFKGTINKAGVKELKKVSIKLVNKAGDYEYVNCSTPVGNWLRESTSPDELQERLNDVATLPILELPQLERDENSANFGQPIMVTDEETGEEKPLVLYSISFTGATDMSSTRTSITDDMLKKEVAKRAINFEDLIAV